MSRRKERSIPNDLLDQLLAGGAASAGFDWRQGTTKLLSDFNNRPDKKESKSDFEGTFTLTAIPEPASWGMMQVGFGMVGFAARRCAKSAVKVTFA